jgi:hypothetical protein
MMAADVVVVVTAAAWFLGDPSSWHLGKRDRAAGRKGGPMPASSRAIALFDDLIAAGSIAITRWTGEARIEGTDVMRDGDVAEFRHS